MPLIARNDIGSNPLLYHESRAQTSEKWGRRSAPPTFHRCCRLILLVSGRVSVKEAKESQGLAVHGISKEGKPHDTR